MKTSIYINWPFSVKKFYYCNYYISSISDHRKYIDCMLSELRFYKAEYPNCIIETVYIGGGSAIEPQLIKELISEIKKLWITCPNLEVSIEIDPCGTDLLKLKSVGINRASIRVQALQDAILKFLGKDYSAQNALNFTKTALQLFPNTSIDLLYGIPGQTIHDIKQAIDYIAQLGLKQVSMYELVIEKNTLFDRKKIKLPSEDELCDIYDLVTQELPKLGLIQYEITSFSAPGWECRHNLAYWKYGNWLSIGPGACGRISKNGTRFALENIKHPKKWLYQIQNKHYTKPIPVIDVLKEELIMKLHISDGLLSEDLQRIKIAPCKIKCLIKQGDIIKKEFGIRLSKKGWLRYNSVIDYLCN